MITKQEVSSKNQEEKQEVVWKTINKEGAVFKPKERNGLADPFRYIYCGSGLRRNFLVVGSSALSRASFSPVFGWVDARGFIYGHRPGHISLYQSRQIYFRIFLRDPYSHYQSFFRIYRRCDVQHYFYECPDAALRSDCHKF